MLADPMATYISRVGTNGINASRCMDIIGYMLKFDTTLKRIITLII